MKISTTIITFNEEENIRDCIESVRDFSDEILIVDSFSTDNTVRIAQELGANVILNKWEGYIKQKKFAILKAKYNWVFSIDADERVSDKLKEKIMEIKNNREITEKYKVCSVNRRNYYLGKWIKYGGWYPERRIRFFQKDCVDIVGLQLHEKIIPKGDFKVYNLNLDIIHYPYKDITHHLNTINNYSSIAAEENFQKGKKVSFFQIIYKPFFKFFRDYILKKGFLLGKVGFIHAAMGAISVFMKYLKTYEKQYVKDKGEK
jgi:glycosyltransferase involved in cell wall biosynthesis